MLLELILLWSGGREEPKCFGDVVFTLLSEVRLSTVKKAGELILLKYKQ
jgi:hypothetical protein